MSIKVYWHDGTRHSPDKYVTLCHTSLFKFKFKLAVIVSKSET